MKTRFYNIWVLVLIISTFSIAADGQINSISIEEALNIAYNNYPGLKRDKLVVDQYNQLAETGVPMQLSQITFTGEEFGSNGQTGVHSLNIQQNFYLPKVSQVQRDYYQKGAVIAEKQLQLTRQELKQEVTKAYYQLLYTKEALDLINESTGLYNDFLNVTTAQLESGETGKLPQMAASSRLGQEKLQLKHAEESYQIALSLFNHWLQSDTIYESEGNLRRPDEYFIDSLKSDNPHLQIIEAQKGLALSKIETEKAKLLPQINTGLKLQTAFGNYPLFGYQIGVNIPLFKKAYNGRIQAAKIDVMVQEETLKTEQHKLNRTISELKYRFNHQRNILQYLEEELSPLVNNQSIANLAAYQEGEIGYLEYLDSLERVVVVKRQFLEALYQYHILKTELAYWLGK